MKNPRAKSATMLNVILRDRGLSSRYAFQAEPGDRLVLIRREHTRDVSDVSTIALARLVADLVLEDRRTPLRDREGAESPGEPLEARLAALEARLAPCPDCDGTGRRTSKGVPGYRCGTCNGKGCKG